MKVVTRAELGAEAIAYIRLNLAKRGSFWEFLADKPLESGCVFAYFPKEPSNQELLRCDQGLFDRCERERGEGDWNSTNKTHDLVHAYLKGEPERLALLKKDKLHPGRDYAFSPLPPVRCLRHIVRHPLNDELNPGTLEIYAYLPGGKIQIEDVSYLIEMGDFWSMTCALTSSKRPVLSSGAEVEIEFLRECASGTEFILMSAYDGDAILVWSKDKSAQEQLEGRM